MKWRYPRHREGTKSLQLSPPKTFQELNPQGELLFVSRNLKKIRLSLAEGGLSFSL